MKRVLFVCLIFFCCLARAQSIDGIEYFIDGPDPGFGNATALTVDSNSGDLTQSFSISTTGLSEGFHSLFMRSQNSDGNWSLYDKTEFYVVSVSDVLQSISGAEYFFDNDPGFGSGTPLSLNANSGSLTQSFSISTTGLEEGLHKFYIRTQNSEGTWSFLDYKSFYIAEVSDASQNITEAEYFFDQDPGFGNATSLALNSNSGSLTQSFVIPTTDLEEGFHSFYIRTKNSEGIWSLYDRIIILIDDFNSIDESIVAAEYFFDGSDPGAGNGTVLDLDENTGELTQSFAIPTTDLDEGNHTLYIRVQTEDGLWSFYDSATFSIDVSAIDNSVTLEDNTLTATYDNDDASYQWLDCDNSSVPIAEATGRSYTPEVSGNYAVQISYDGQTVLSECIEVIIIDTDVDDDGIDDVDDNCPSIANADQADLDNDGEGDVCDEDDDGDGILDTEDNCPSIANADQTDTDSDGEGDACDDDDDGDGILDVNDNCPLIANADQTDTDNDGEGDACDDDDDGDGILDVDDNCPLVANADQTDTDSDGEGDACDEDDDDDGILDVNDNCPLVANADQTDTDSDGEGDACDEDDDGDGVLDVNDNCPLVANADQTDTDSDGEGDICDEDDDGDGVLDTEDNCPLVANADQADGDSDGLGDVCDDDWDNDGVSNDLDACDDTPSGAIVDTSGCEIFTLSADNFTIKATGESCISSNNGSIEIEAVESYNYTATLNGSSSNSFTDSTSFSNLEAGEHEICITIDGQADYEQCFAVNVSEPQPLSVYSKVDDSSRSVILDLDGGTLYTINLNGIIYKTSEDSITLSLTEVENKISVSTDKDCQGTYEETIIIASEVLVYPNPVYGDHFTVELASLNVSQVEFNLYSEGGQLINAEKVQLSDSSLEINVSGLPKGIYILNLRAEANELNYKIIKQ